MPTDLERQIASVMAKAWRLSVSVIRSLKPFMPARAPSATVATIPT